MLEKTVSNKGELDALMARVKKAQAEYALFSQEQVDRIFRSAALAAARRVAPDLPLGYLWDVPPEDWLARAARHGVYSLHCSARGASEAVLATARAHEIPVLCWTVNDRAQAENLLARGATSVICDQIGVMRGL